MFYVLFKGTQGNNKIDTLAWYPKGLKTEIGLKQALPTKYLLSCHNYMSSLIQIKTKQTHDEIMIICCTNIIWKVEIIIFLYYT